MNIITEEQTKRNERKCANRIPKIEKRKKKHIDELNKEKMGHTQLLFVRFDRHSP